MAIVRYRDENGNIVPLRAIKGDNGDQMYVRFSAYADGTDMSEKWDAERNYMGIAFARVAPSNKEAYQWISLADISLGRYAEEGSAEKYLFFVGNGTDENNRSNALTVDEEGNAWLAGDITLGEDSYSPRTEIEGEKVARAEHIEQAVTDVKEWIRPVSSGGTGGTTAEDARYNLGINRELFNVPEWNVNENVGIISPSTEFDLKILSTEQEGQKSVSFPMINSGRVRLDFVLNSSNMQHNTPPDQALYSWKQVVEVYVNENLVQTHGETTYSYLRDKKCETTLDVSVGDVVTLIAKVSVHNPNGLYVGATDWCELKVSDIQLKANIATAHTYLSLGEDLGNPTSDEILETLLGV